MHQIIKPNEEKTITNELVKELQPQSFPMKRSKWRNRFFALVVLVFLLGPLCLSAVESAGVSLPGWLTAEDSTYLSCGIAKADIAGNLSIDGYASKRLQMAAENTIGNAVPLKAKVIYLNGALQRNAIELSNTLFRWECYPAVYGSDYFIVPDQNRIVLFPNKMSDGVIEGIDDYSQQLNAFAKKHPEISFVTYFVPGWRSAPYNPSEQLVSSSVTYSEIQKNVLADLSNEIPNNVTYLFSSYEGEQGKTEYLNDYYHFDHHWNNRGAARAYYQIADSLDMPLREAGDCFEIPGSAYSGSYARGALFDVSEPFIGISNSLNSTVVVDSSGEERIMGEHVRYYNAGLLERHYNAYTLYSEALEGSTIDSGNGDKNVLLISDSYGGALQYFLPLSCNKLIQRNDLAAKYKGEERLDSLLLGQDVDAVVFVAFPGNYSGFLGRYPHFFD